MGKTITNFIFLVDCEWNDFGEWTSCSKTCGGGERSRSRIVKTIEQKGGNPCTGEATEVESCNTNSCTGIHNKY